MMPQSCQIVHLSDEAGRASGDIPAVTHVDYSARVQTVHKDTNRLYHAVISKFKEATGRRTGSSRTKDPGTAHHAHARPKIPRNSPQRGRKSTPIDTAVGKPRLFIARFV